MTLGAPPLRPPPGACWVKVCCVTSVAELELAAGAGAQAVGLVGPMPSGPGVIDEARIRELAAAAPPGCTPVLLTSRDTAAGIAAQVAETGVAAVQVCRPLAPEVAAELRRLLPAHVPAIHVVHVDGPEALARARALEPHSDAILLDSGAPDATTPRLGGTGAVHDWPLSAQIRAAVACPVLLAGGLRPSNVAQAVREVAPAWVDVCTGLRPNRGLDPELLRAFLEAVNAA